VNSYFRLKLFLLIIGFTVVIAVAIAISDYIELREQAVVHNQLQVEQIEELVKDALQSIEKAYHLFDLDTSADMEENGRYVLEKYQTNPSFETWDFALLKKKLGMDIYVINDQNVIIHASFEEDIGLDFNRCCPKLAPVLDEIRRSGGYLHDGLDIEQKTGRIRRYSYFATPDRRYIIQLGYAVQNSLIFDEFNFLKVIDELVNRYPCVEAIHVLNLGGYPLGEPAEKAKLTGARRAAFETTLDTKETTEIRGYWNNKPAVFRYVHYNSSYDTGTTQVKVLEIIYNEIELQNILRQHTQTLLIKLVLVVISAALVASFISRWVAKPMYLAFHDSLTGLRNRAAFEETLKEKMADPAGRMALLIIDLDHFKEVNDRLGHDEGDRLLKCVAQQIRSVVRKGDIPFRLGGDEFVVLLPGADEERARATATRIIDAVTSTSFLTQDRTNEVTVSIGIALSPQHGLDRNVLFKRADLALYRAKERGKNQYQVYALN
jgi:diguanylate cyclase (GGDEF)-like protein